MIHPDTQYHADIKALEGYIVEVCCVFCKQMTMSFWLVKLTDQNFSLMQELNVREILVTSDEDKFGVKYRAEADWKVLGQKLKKDAMKVKKALPGITSEQVKEFVRAKEMVVDGIKVTDEDLNVSINLTMMLLQVHVTQVSISLFRLFVTLIKRMLVMKQTLIVMCLSYWMCNVILSSNKKVLHVK